MNGRRAGTVARGLTYLLTYTIKAVGLIAAIKQLLFIPHPEALPLEVSAFMMAGAQVSESLIIAVLDRIMGQPGKKDEKERDK